MPTQRQLANLREPIQQGEVRNPEGRNQYRADRELRQQFRAICRAIDEAPNPVADAIYEELAKLVIAGAIEEPRLKLAILDRLWPPLRAEDRAASRHKSKARVRRWASAPPI